MYCFVLLQAGKCHQQSYIFRYCGKPFTLSAAIETFDKHFDGEFYYMEEFVGQLCGKCTVSDVE